MLVSTVEEKRRKEEEEEENTKRKERRKERTRRKGRRKEHSGSLWTRLEVGNVEHVRIHNQSSLYEMDWSIFCAIDQGSKKKEGKIRKAFHIYKRRPRLDRDQGEERSAIWKTVL